MTRSIVSWISRAFGRVSGGPTLWMNRVDFSLTHCQRQLRHKAPDVSERETPHCPGRSPSGREGLANQMPVSSAAGFLGGKKKLTSTSPPSVCSIPLYPPGTIQPALGTKWGVSLLKGCLCPSQCPSGSPCFLIQVQLISPILLMAWHTAATQRQGINPYVLLGTFSSTKGCCWVLIWPQLFLCFSKWNDFWWQILF